MPDSDRNEKYANIIKAIYIFHLERFDHKLIFINVDEIKEYNVQDKNMYFIHYWMSNKNIEKHSDW